MSSDKQAQLDRLYLDYAEEGKTGVLQELAANSKGYVRGAGPLDAPLVVVGEAPGETEEREDEPFVGKSGILLQNLFGRAGVPWPLCYRMNVIPWRPAKNRAPYPYEVMASWARVEREIAIIGPYVVIAVGATAWHGVTRNQHGRFAEQRYRWLYGRDSGRPYDLLAIHHPAWLLRQPALTCDALERGVVSVLKSVFTEETGDDAEH